MAIIDWNTVVGDSTVDNGGYIGDLLKLARAHVDEAIRNNELTQEAAGQIYTAMIPAAFENGITFAMQDSMTEAQIAKIEADTALVESQTSKSASDKALVDAQVSKTAANKLVLDAQKALYERQTKGFDEAKKQKLFDAQINAWALSYSTGANTVLPTSMSNDSLTSLYNSINT